MHAAPSMVGMGASASSYSLPASFHFPSVADTVRVRVEGSWSVVRPPRAMGSEAPVRVRRKSSRGSAS